MLPVVMNMFRIFLTVDTLTYSDNDIMNKI